ncbi:MAG: transcriptional regulator BetI [Pseudomonadota bacterium]
MPRASVQPARREALIKAAIEEVGTVGLVDVTVSRIARRAGVSSALAHHYLGSKDDILQAAMRRILTDYGEAVREAYRTAKDPRARIDAVIRSSFCEGQFDRAVIGAWLTFYVQAHHSAEASRLLSIYARRLDSNLVHALRSLVPLSSARRIAQGLASMIDGFYIRAALQEGAPDRTYAIAMVTEYLDLCLEKELA